MRRLALVLALAAATAGGSVARAGCSPTHEWQDAGPRWSPDGSRIAFYRVLPGCDPAPVGISVLSAAGGRVRQLGIATRGQWPPSWSPDGRLLAFGGQRGIVVHEADGRGFDEVTRGQDFAPAWSPDGAWIAFRRGPASQSELWIVRLDGSGARRLAGRLHDHTLPVWSPDSGTLAFAAAARSTDIHTVDVATNEIRSVASTPASDLDPAWSPDGSTIAFETEGGGIWTVRRDGTALTRVAAGRDPSWSPAGELTWSDQSGLRTERTLLSGFRDILGAAVWSPDGRRVAFAAGGICLRYGIYLAPELRLTNRCVRRGTHAADTLRGTGFRDFVYGYAGADRLLGLGRRDLLDGGPGDDVLDGGGGWDTLLGRGGADLLIGRGDPDTIVGGPGRDRIFAGRSGDMIYARDGWRDTIACGAGWGVDTVYADRRDAVARNCERVIRG